MSALLAAVAAGLRVVDAESPAEATVPGSPGGFTVTPGPASAIFSWEAPDDGGSAILRYEYRTPFVLWAEIPMSAPGQSNATSHTLDGLTPGTVYRFSLRAVNRVGAGDGTTYVPVTPLAT